MTTKIFLLSNIVTRRVRRCTWICIIHRHTWSSDCEYQIDISGIFSECFSCYSALCCVSATCKMTNAIKPDFILHSADSRLSGLPWNGNSNVLCCIRLICMKWCLFWVEGCMELCLLWRVTLCMHILNQVFHFFLDTKFNVEIGLYYKVYLKSNRAGVTNNLFQFRATDYMVSPSK